MSKAVLFLLSFGSFIAFVILMFQNIGYNSYDTYFNLFVAQISWKPGIVLALGFMTGIATAIPLLIFVRTGGNIKISDSSEKSEEGNLEWD